MSNGRGRCRQWLNVLGASPYQNPSSPRDVSKSAGDGLLDVLSAPQITGEFGANH
jgi:hypothetical protein